MTDGDSYGYNLRTLEHRYFFVEQFYETDLSAGSMGTKIFNLANLLGTDEMSNVEQIAELLKDKSWS